MDEEFFNNLKERHVRALKNSLLAEPYERLGMYRAQIMFGDESTEETLKALEGITFERL